MLTVPAIDSLSALEPCGNGCPKPVLMMEKLTVDRVSMVGGGRHMRLRLRHGRHGFNAIFFSADPVTTSVEPGDLVDVAFQPQVNEYRNERTVQMNVQDIRPSCAATCSADMSSYRSFRRGEVTAEQAARLTPDRAKLGMVWRYLGAANQPLQEDPVCLCRKIVRHTGTALDLDKLLVCLYIFADVKLLQIDRHHKYMTIRLCSRDGKADLQESQTLQRLLQAKES